VRKQRRLKRRSFYFRLFKSLLVISPLAFLIFYGFIMNKLFEALLFLVAWTQLELYALQIVIQEKQSRPRFVAELRHTGKRVPFKHYLVVHNVGSTAAYMVGVCSVLDKEHNPVDPAEWSRFVKARTADISPEGSSVVAEDSQVLEALCVSVVFWYGAARYFT